LKLFSPLNLAWLLLLVPVIVFFYLLKLKRKEVMVSSVLLWSHLVKDVQANAPFQKLKKNLLLLLQLLIACLAILALARPAFFSTAMGGDNVVIILDGSASMQSRDGERGSRFDEAKRRALRMVADMRGGDRMMVVLATSRTHRLSSFTSDKGALRRAINEAEPGDTTTNLRDAALLAASVVGQRHGMDPETQGQRLGAGQIFLLSDGAFGEMDELDTRGAQFVFEKVGSRSDNVGLVAMDVRRAFTDRGGYQMFVALRNYGAAARKCNLEFYRNDALIDVRPVELPAADKENGFSEKAEVLKDLPEATGILRARLDIEDDLVTDNEAFAQLSARQNVNVLLVSEGNLYLQSALNLDPQVKLSVVTPSGYNAQEGFDVTVFENFGPKKLGPGAHLYINCSGETSPAEPDGRIKNARILTWERTHPVMRYVKLSDLDLQDAFEAKKRPWGVVLAEHEGGVAIAVGEREGTKSGYVGFPLLGTQFPIRIAFPIFFSNMIQWLAASPGRTEGLQLRAGQTASIEVPPTAGEITITDPKGDKAKIKPDGRLAYYGSTDRTGIYRVQGKGFQREFAVNLLSRDESATKPQDKIQFGRRPVQAGVGATQSAHEIWRWLLLAALVVLGLEWWVFHKRI
jgi:Ca-activated chloride channel homolog